MIWQSIKRIDSTDENVSKFVFTTDSAVAESVLYKYPTFKERTVICCSTQSGCPMGCRFCFMPGTLVDTIENGTIVQKKIEDINVGDSLVGLKKDNIVVQTLNRDYSGNIIEIELENGKTVLVTEDHEMIDIDGNIVLAKDLKEGDCLKE